MREVCFNFEMNSSWRMLSVEGPVEELLGYTAEQFVQGAVDLRNRIHAHDQDIRELLFSPDNPSSGGVNVRLRQANGRIRCIKGRYRKNISGNTVRLSLVLQDAKSLWKPSCDQIMMANFKAMMENTNDYIYFKDRNHVFTGASETLVSLTDPSEHWTDLLGKTDYDVFPEAYADIYYELEKQVFSGVQIAHDEQEIIDNAGNKGWVDNRKYPIYDDEGEITGLFGIARDITRQKATEAALKESNDKFRALTETTQDFVWEVSAEGIYTYCSPQVRDILGYEPEECLGKTPFDFMPEEEIERIRDIFFDSVKHKRPIRLLENCNITKEGRKVILETNGQPFFDTRGDLLGYRGIDRDITQRKKDESRLKYLATHDVLTGLYNRQTLEDRLRSDINRAARYGHPLSLLMLDIDYFKSINDIHGHRAGDELLRQFSVMIKASIRKTDYAARYGGEEFVVVLPETQIAKAEEMAHRLIGNIAGHAFSIPENENNKLTMTASIGMAHFPEHGRLSQELLHAADKAMYRAKRAGRNQAAF